MDIRVVSSLIPEDEEGVAPRILEALRACLAPLPIAYTIRLETSSGRVLEECGPLVPAPPEETERRL